MFPPSIGKQHIHKSYLRTVPAYSHQAIVWADIVEHFEWSSVVIITSSDQDGRSILSTFRKRMVDYHRFKVRFVIGHYAEQGIA